jgi:putative ABC transport system permease protein
MRFADAPLLQWEHFEAQRPTGPDSPLSLGGFTYIRLKPGASPREIERRATAAIRGHLRLPDGSAFHLELIPLAAIHLRPPAGGPLKPSSDVRVIATIGLVGILILIIAALNFVNLSTACAAQRSLEIGIRKSCGAGQRDLIVQFIGESILCVTLATLVAMALVELLLPAFNALIDRSLGKYPAPHIMFEYWRDPLLALVLVLGILLLGVAAGAYPALVLARFKAASVLRGGPLRNGSFQWRQAFVILQFTILIVLMIATTVIERQMLFALNEGLRINRQQVLLIFFSDPQIRERFQVALAADPGVIDVTSSFTSPTNFGMSEQPLIRPDAKETTLSFSPVDFNFLKFYGLPLLAGRDFSRSHGADSTADAGRTAPLSIIINESAMRRLGFSKPQEAIGLTLRSPNRPEFRHGVTVIGVVPDFPISSVDWPMENVAYLVHAKALVMISARLKGTDIPETLARIDQLWKTLGEPRAIPRQFLDEYYDYVYSGNRQQAKLFAAFSTIAVLIACLGLFGLSVFSAQRRTKEIGIRKAMGADRFAVLRLLLWQFMKPVLAAIIIATPIAAYLMSRWLEAFSVRVSLHPGLILAPSAAALVIAAVTVGVHCYFVAERQPVSALRYE